MPAASSGNSDGPPGGGPSFIAPPMWDAVEDSAQPLTEEEQAVLAVNAAVVRLRKGEIVFDAGEPASALFSIINGAVKLYRVQPSQREHIARFMFTGDLIGLAENGRYINSAKSIITTILYKMPTRALATRLMQNPRLEFRIINKLSHELRRTQDHALLLAKHHASAKIGMFIQMVEADQKQTEAGGGELYLPMTRADIAAYMGVSPEAVSRGFADLVGCGAIAFGDRRHLRIADRAKLEAVIAETERHRARERPIT